MGYWDEENDDYVEFDDYDEMVKKWGYEVLVWEADDDYQGDTYTLLKDGDRYGFLTFGWGSCSGCDALQACSSQADFDELNEKLKTSIHWEDNRDAMKDFFIQRDWETQWMWREDAFRRFLDEVGTLLILGSWADSLKWDSDDD